MVLQEQANAEAKTDEPGARNDSSASEGEGQTAEDGGKKQPGGDVSASGTETENAEKVVEAEMEATQTPPKSWIVTAENLDKVCCVLFGLWKLDKNHCWNHCWFFYGLGRRSFRLYAIADRCWGPEVLEVWGSGTRLDPLLEAARKNVSLMQFFSLAVVHTRNMCRCHFQVTLLF